jgi:hypothetical protein
MFPAMKLLLRIVGASKAELRRGINAAQQVFNRAGRLGRSRDQHHAKEGHCNRSADAVGTEACQPVGGSRAGCIARLLPGLAIYRIPSDAGLEPLFDSDHSDAAERMRAIYREN